MLQNRTVCTTAGAINGVTKNFEVLVDILGNFKKVSQVKEGKEPSVAETVSYQPLPVRSCASARSRSPETFPDVPRCPCLACTT